MRQVTNVRDVTYAPIHLLDHEWDVLFEQTEEYLAKEFGAGWKIHRTKYDFVNDSEIHRYCIRVTAWLVNEWAGW